MKKVLKIILIFGFFFLFLIVFFEIQLLINLPFWLVILIGFISGSIFSFILIPHRKGLSNIELKDFLYVLVFGFIFAEIVFVLNFWPFNCITTASVLFVVYFMIWDIWSYEKKNKLSYNKVIIDLVIVIFSICALLATTKWIP